MFLLSFAILLCYLSIMKIKNRIKNIIKKALIFFSLLTHKFIETVNSEQNNTKYSRILCKFTFKAAAY